MYYQQADGTWGLTEEGFNPKAARLWETGNNPDYVTIGGVGGAHSDYTNLGSKNDYNLMQFTDEQKINPQWVIASGLKKALFTDSNSKIGKVIDKFGSYPLGDKLFGYKPFTIKQNYI